MRNKYFLYRFILRIGFLVSLLQVLRFALIGKYSVVCNSGIAFGIHFPLQLSISLSALFLFWLGFVWWKEVQYISLGMVLVFSGAISNLFERMVYGCVSDYIHPIAFFPAFNGADIILIAGLGITLWISRYSGGKSELAT